MEIVRIGEGKMKLILDCADVKKYGITEAALSSDTAARRRALARLLEDVGARTGADLTHARAFLEAFPDKTGGCEIFVRVEACADAGRTLYRFEDFPNLFSAARQMKDVCGEGCRSSLYSMGEGGYFLSVSLPLLRGEGGLSPYSFLEEYGAREKDPLVTAYVREYGICLCHGEAIPYILAGKEKFTV